MRIFGRQMAKPARHIGDNTLSVLSNKDLAKISGGHNCGGNSVTLRHEGTHWETSCGTPPIQENSGCDPAI